MVHIREYDGLIILVVAGRIELPSSSENLTRIKIINYEKTQTNEHEKILLLLSPVLAPPGKPPRAVAGGGVNPKYETYSCCLSSRRYG